MASEYIVIYHDPLLIKGFVFINANSIDEALQSFRVTHLYLTVLGIGLKDYIKQ